MAYVVANARSGAQEAKTTEIVGVSNAARKGQQLLRRQRQQKPLPAPQPQKG